MKSNFVLKKIIFWMVPILFIFICLIKNLSRIPFFDEAHAYSISQLPYKQIFQLTSIEGHSFLWFCLLKIFSFDSSFYPYPMLFLNWIIISAASLFFWKYSPFNLLVKSLIIFSAPMLNYFGVVSRPYSLLLLVLFVLTHFYNNKLHIKKPVIFSLLLVLCGYISIIGIIGAFSFFVLFLTDIIKNRLNKKTICIVFLIFFIAGMLLFLQLYNPELASVSKRNGEYNFIYNIFHFIGIPFLLDADANYLQLLFYFVGSVTFYVVIFHFAKFKNSFVFLAGTYFLMTCLFCCIYPGANWHYYFYLVFLLIAYWISYEKLIQKKFLNIILSIFLFLTLSPYSFYLKGNDDVLNAEFYPAIIEIVKEYNDKNSKLYCFDYFSHFSVGLPPYLKKEDIKVYDQKGYELGSFENLKNVFNYKTQNIDVKEFLSVYNKNKKNYLFKRGDIFEKCFNSNKLSKINEFEYLYQDDGIKIYLKQLKDYKELMLSVWEIIVVNDDFRINIAK